MSAGSGDADTCETSHLRVLTRTPFLAHSTPSDAAICLTAGTYDTYQSAVRGERSKRGTRTGFGGVVRRLGLRDVDDLCGGAGYQPRRFGRSDRGMRGLTLALMLATRTMLPPP